MKTIKQTISEEIIINKSKFIGILIPISKKEDVLMNIDKIKKQYPNATHYCLAYIVDNIEKCDDNGEPSGTAGIVILNALKANKLTNILCIIVRYFGGIKLGAGGLIRAYNSITCKTINNAEIKDIVNGYEITIEFDYDNVKNIDYILKNKMIEKQFNEKIIYTFKLEATEYQEIKENLLKFSTILKQEKIKFTN